MLFQRLVGSTLICSLSVAPCLAQVAINPNRGFTTDRTAPASPSITELRRRAGAGDAYAAYLLGRNWEAGIGAPNNRPDPRNAIAWYNIAIRGGSLQATYRLGQLMAAGKALAPQPGGTYKVDVTRGNSMMRYAVANGYSPQTDTVIPPARTVQRTPPPQPAAPPSPERQSASSTQTQPASSSSSSDDVAGALLLGLGALAVLAIAASDSSSSSSSSSSSDSSLPADPRATKTCTILYTVPITPDPTYPGTTTEQRSRVGYGYECP